MHLALPSPRTLALPFVFAALVGGCPDTRGTCPIACDNAVRCGFATDHAACEAMCTRNLGTASPDCRTQSDRYERCWIAAGTCPFSPTLAASGCATEFNDRALACTAGSPLLETDASGI